MHMPVDASHRPRFEQLSSHGSVSHAAPAHAPMQWQLPVFASHVPCDGPEHCVPVALFAGHESAPQSAPLRPGGHTHCPEKERHQPAPEHSSGAPGHRIFSHAAPVQPPSHAHAAAVFGLKASTSESAFMHTPRPPQWGSAQSICPQSAPPYPGSHVQAPVVSSQVPRPEHPFSQSLRLHVGPVHPAAHAHAPVAWSQ